MNSGTYTFEPVSKAETEEEQSESSLYNLLHHSQEDLFELSLAITGRLLMLDQEKNPAMYARMQAWSTLVESAMADKNS